MKLTRIAAIVFSCAALAVFAAPRIPGSPVACLHVPAGCRTESQLDWVFGLAFVLPAGIAAAAMGWRRR